MANFIQKFENQSAYDAAEHQYPNVSLVGTDIVYKMEAEFNGIIAKYDVTSTSEATTLLHSNTNITNQIIDGVQQSSVQTTYTFDTLGEHIVEYMLDGTSIGEEVFSRCSSLTSIEIQNSVTSIGFQTFIECTNLTSVTIGSGVTSIGQNAFRSCTSLTYITIPDSVTSIGGSAFYNCTSLTSVTIGSGVTSIDVFAFNNCSGLTSVTVEALTPPTLADANAFNSTNDCPIYVPAESVDTYKAAENWNTYASRLQSIPTT